MQRNTHGSGHNLHCYILNNRDWNKNRTKIKTLGKCEKSWGDSRDDKNTSKFLI